MAKGTELKNTRVVDLITEIYSGNKLLKAPAVHKEVLRRIHDEKDDYYEPYIDDPEWPRENTVYKHLKEIIKTDEARPPESKRLDEPWSIGALVKYPIPPECLPAVLRAFYAERLTDVATDEYFRIGYEFGHESYLTIRQALWIARLSPLFKYPTIVLSVDPSGAFDTYAAYEAASEERTTQYAEFNLVTAKLVYWARFYALRERMNEIMQKPLDTSKLDIALLGYARDAIYRSLVSFPNLIRYSWEDTLNHLKKEAHNER